MIIKWYLYSFRQKSSLFKVESWFLSHVRRWLKTTNAATPEWVGNAIKQDDVILIKFLYKIFLSYNAN